MSRLSLGIDCDGTDTTIDYRSLFSRLSARPQGYSFLELSSIATCLCTGCRLVPDKVNETGKHNPGESCVWLQTACILGRLAGKSCS